MKWLKLTWALTEKTIGVYIAGITFMVMFCSFCIQIIFRYLYNYQFEWTYEFTVIGFIWTSVFGACYSGKIRDHVSFSLVHDKLKPVGQAIMTLVGNSIVLLALLLLLPAAFEYVEFMRIKPTPVLKLPFNILYGPFLLFLVFSIIYLVRDIALSIRSIIGKSGEKADMKEEV